MNNFRYILEPYSGINSRFTCPRCNKKSSFSRYIDQEKSEYLPFEFGKCNRLVKCGYWLDPYKEKQLDFDIRERKSEPVKIEFKNSEVVPSFHDFQEVYQSMKQFENNSLVIFLAKRYGLENTKYLIDSYYLGTSKKYRKHGNGGVIFWNIDKEWKVRGGKIFGYNSETGKRIKKPFVLQNWVHKVNPKYKDIQFNLSHCFFGEHLLNKYPFKPVALVESEKTALICTLYLPNFIWLATGSLQGISLEKSKSLKGRVVYLFPDLSIDGIAFNKWHEKLSFLKEIAKKVEISNLLENLAPEQDRLNGYDLADYFLNISLEEWKTIKTNHAILIENSASIQKNYERFSFSEYLSSLKIENGILINGPGYPASWDTISSYEGINHKTKQIILLASKNPQILKFISNFDLE